jgi:hypothetical protein
VVGASCTLNISFKHTTGDYLEKGGKRRRKREKLKSTMYWGQRVKDR